MLFAYACKTLDSAAAIWLTEKALVRDFYGALDTAADSEIDDVLNRFCAPDYLWRGYHPFNENRTPSLVANLFWRPLRQALTRLQRRMDVF
ncbi:MAG: hypothetical protein ACPG61_06845, partial [Paracoccaceae bacterium]